MGYVLCYAQEGLDITGVLRLTCIAYCFNFFGVGLDITETKNMAIEPDFTLRELAFVFVEAKVVVFKSLENITKVLVMLII